MHEGDRFVPGSSALGAQSGRAVLLFGSDLRESLSPAASKGRLTRVRLAVRNVPGLHDVHVHSLHGTQLRLCAHFHPSCIDRWPTLEQKCLAVSVWSELVLP